MPMRQLALFQGNAVFAEAANDPVYHSGPPPWTEGSRWHRWYQRYLRSERWHRTRALKLAIEHDTCELCRDIATLVHHKTYDRAGYEEMEDLEAVCQQCHDEIHGRRNAA